MELKAKIYGQVPSKSNSYRIIQIRGKDGKQHASLAKAEALRKYEKAFYLQCPGAMRNRYFDKFFELEVDVYYNSLRPDLDNAMKVILDCLEAANVIKNDNKCMRIVAQKFVDKKEPRVELLLKLIE